MKGKYFLDTNVIVYSFDNDNPKKQVIAKKLIAEAIKSGAGIVSYQVVQEFLNVATKKFSPPLSEADAVKFYQSVLEPLFEIVPSSELFLRALEIKERWKYSFYDSLIISAALEGDCQTLYSEDLHDGHKIEHLTIVNPFKAN